jgi:integrase
MSAKRIKLDLFKLGIRGTCFIRNGGWWLRFHDPETRKMRRVSLKTTDDKIAKQKGTIFLTIAADQGMSKLKAVAGLRNESPTIAALVEHYEKVSDCDTAHRNITALLRVIARAKGWDHGDRRTMSEAVKAKVMAVRSTELTAETAVAYQRADDGTNNYTKGTTLAGAKAVFAHTKDWIGFHLPDLSAFLKTSKQAKQKYDPNSFQHIDKDTLDAMEQDSRKDKLIRRAFICCRYLGMTPKEVSYARRSWIESRPNGQTMCIRERKDQAFTLKTGGARERDITLPAWMAEELTAADDYLLPYETPFLRYNYMLRVFNLWVRRFIPDRKGAAYELRKQAGSNWLEATGQISQVQYLLGHSTPTTTARWYATWQKAVTVPLVFQERPL